MSGSDRALIRGCLKHDKASWDLFIERYNRLVYWSIHRTLERTDYASRADLVKDLFQEVFTQLLDRRTLRRLKDSPNVAGYLTVLASHTAIDRIRSLSSAEKRLKAQSELESVPEAFAAWQGAERAEAALAVREALNGLSRRERACVEQHYLNQRPHSEIAELMGLPRDTVSSIIRRVKDKLRQGLTEKGII